MSAHGIVAGTRGSKLALTQTRYVCGRLGEIWPGMDVAEEIIRTTGDDVQDRPLAAIGTKGVFTRALDEALLAGRIDFAVHSLKDLPGELCPGTVIAAVPPRQDPRDCLCAAPGVTLSDLRPGAVVGTGSPRRRAQLAVLRPDLEIRDIRGNVDTRLAKIGSGYDAVILAAAGLRRLGLESRINQLFDPGDVVPAIGQGALAVQCRSDDADTLELLQPLACVSASRETAAERALGRTIEAGCHVPVGALATVSGARISIRAVLCSADSRAIVCATCEGSAADASDIGAAAGQELLAQGAELLTIRTEST